jgi:hypothetical protein
MAGTTTASARDAKVTRGDAPASGAAATSSFWPRAEGTFPSYDASREADKYGARTC